MLNIDWFNPFKHTQCGVGVMYVSCSSDEYPMTKIENVLIVGLIPGPSEPSLHFNFRTLTLL